MAAATLHVVPLSPRTSLGVQLRSRDSPSSLSFLKTVSYDFSQQLRRNVTQFSRNNREPHQGIHRGVRAAAIAGVLEVESLESCSQTQSEEYDAIVIGAGIGGLVAATQLAIRGARVILLEKYVIPGGSSGYFEREGYTFDVGSSVMFGFSKKVFVSPLPALPFLSWFHCAYFHER